MKKEYKKRGNPTYKKVLIIVVIVLFSSYILHLYAKKCFILYKKNQEVILLRDKILTLENKNLELEKKIEKLHEEDEIKKEARKLGLVEEGEKAIKIFTIKSKKMKKEAK